jgi:hypothetical protein
MDLYFAAFIAMRMFEFIMAILVMKTIIHMDEVEEDVLIYNMWIFFIYFLTLPPPLALILI